MAAKRTRTRYTDEQKRTILAAADSGGLTAAQVQKKYGVKPITYYSWRKKSGAAKRRGRPAGGGRTRAAGVGRAAGRAAAQAINNLDAVRSEVQSRLRAMMPDIVRSEVDAFFSTLGGGVGGARRGRRRGRPPGRPRKKK